MAFAIDFGRYDDKNSKTEKIARNSNPSQRRLTAAVCFHYHFLDAQVICGGSDNNIALFSISLSRANGPFIFVFRIRFGGTASSRVLLFGMHVRPGTRFGGTNGETETARECESPPHSAQCPFTRAHLYTSYVSSERGKREDHCAPRLFGAQNICARAFRLKISHQKKIVFKQISTTCPFPRAGPGKTSPLHVHQHPE